MSVDKFGRWSGEVIESIDGTTYKGRQGPPGIGFKLTSAGNYDINSKRLVNVGKGINGREAVNLDQLNMLEKSCLKLLPNGTEYDFEGKRIVNLSEPVKDDDVVKISYLKRYCLMSDGKEDPIFNIEKGKLKNLVQTPVDPYDVVNKAYVDQILPLHQSEGWNFKSKRVLNLANPQFETDGATKNYVDSRLDGFKLLNDLNIDEKLRFFYESKKVLDVQHKRIINLADPINMTDACSINYLVRLLSNMFLAFYSQLTPNAENFQELMLIPGARDEWINRNIVHPFFIDPMTNQLRSYNIN